MLLITGDGRKLPPYVIFKKKSFQKYHKGILVRANLKGWMDNDLVVDWVSAKFTTYVQINVFLQANLYFS